jgi:hypothetical protein
MAAVQRQAETSKSSAPQAATDRRDAATTDSPSSAAWSARTTVLLSTRTQAAPLTISSPGDAAEHEAETLAHRVVSMPPPASAPHLSRGSPLAARAPAAAPASGGDQAQTTAATADAIRAELGGGAPLPKAVQDFMAPRFKADFSGVRIHTDAKAENLATRLGAKAFTYGRHVFFNRGQFQPASKAGKELIAHELAHTIQQSATVQRQVDTTVSQRAQPQVQRGIISEALDWFADKANYIPGFRLITVVIGINPINMSRVERSAANILRALVEFLPGGGLIVEALDRYGIFDKAGSWIESQIASLGIGLGSIKAALDAFVNGLGVADAFRLGAVWERAKRIFTEPIDRLISFARSLVSAVLDLIKEAILKPLAALAARTPGWDLLKAVLGRDPITGEAVPRTADTLIGGFMKLIGQEEIWENIKRANAIARAWAWFQSAISGLMALVTSIPERFMSTLRSLVIMDLVLPPRALLKVAGAFASFMGDFLSWAGGTVMDLLKIIMEVVAPGVMPYVKKAAGAFDTIIRNPIGFVGTLVQAGKLGFSNFAKNFLTHLRASLVGWLTGAMTGAAVYIPQGFSLREILKFALSVLGLTWTNIRTKLVAATNETVVRALETGFDIVVTLVTEGPAAAWQKILETLSNLRDMVIEQVMTFVKDRIVSAAVTRLLSMLSPAGAFIQAIIAIYNTVMFFVERLRQIAAVAASFIDAIATIAAGNIAPAAARVESTLAGLLTLVISFLARIAGLGRVADAVTNIINRIRAPINNALDRVVAWIVTQARRLGRFVAQAGVPHDPAERLRLGMRAAKTVVNAIRGPASAAVIAPLLVAIKTRYAFQTLEAVERGGIWWLRARINPTAEERTEKRLRDLTPVEIGAAIEPIFVAIENQWLTARSVNATATETRNMRRAVTAVAAGGPSPRRRSERGRVQLPPLTRAQEIQLLRSIELGNIRVREQEGRTIRAPLHLSGGTETTGGMYLNQLNNQGRTYVQGPGRYEAGRDSSIPAHVARTRRAVGAMSSIPASRREAETLARLSPGHRRLSVVESARAEGMETSRVLGESMVGANITTAAAVTHGPLAPMAFVGASGQDMNLPANTEERQLRIGNLIQRLRAQIGRVRPGANANAAALTRVAAAVNAWMRAQFAPTGNAAQKKARLEAAIGTLQAEFLRLFAVLGR